MKNAVETIKEIIRNRVWAMNHSREENVESAYTRFNYEVMGMLVCLKNIVDDGNFYTINIDSNRYAEFGYYDKDSKWHAIQ